MKKSTIIIISILVAITIAITAYFCFTKSSPRNVWNFIPQDAVYIVETNNISKGWNTIAESKMWTQLVSDPIFEDYQENALALDSLIRINKTMNRLIANKKSLVSCHLLNNNSYDFLTIINIKKVGKLSYIKSFLGEIVDLYGYDMNTEKYLETDIFQFTEKKNGNTIYLSIIENVLIFSYSKKLIQNSIFAAQSPELWKNNSDFQKISSDTTSSLFHFYVSHKYLSKFISYYISGQEDLLREFKKIFNYSAFDFNFKDEKIVFDGSTTLKDSISSYLHTLSNISPGEIQAYKIIPDNMALYLSITFDDYMDFYNKLKDKFQSIDSTYAVALLKKKAKVEKRLKINLEKDFFSWIGNEIALVKLPPNSNSEEYDVLACIHTNDIDDAQSGLTKICKHVNKKTPVKILETEYKGIPIHYFALNGFFKMFFGKLFAQLDKPYFIYLDDFVIFSNTREGLSEMIDAWLKRRTLENSDEFMDFVDNFDKSSNVSVFIKGPKIYNHLYHYAQSTQKKSIRENKELIVSFQYSGFQLISEKTGLFANKLIVQHNMDALYEEEMENMENKAEKLYVDEFDSLRTIKCPGKVKNGENCQVFKDNDSTRLIAEGKIRRKKPDDIWRFYYNNDNIKGTVTFDKGTAEGKALLFFNNSLGNTMAEAVFDDGKKDGEYLEFYKNGTPKCKLRYKKDKLTGDAKFFYNTGVLKIEGQYKHGLKHGKWKHYTETGELYNKERWKKDRKK